MQVSFSGWNWEDAITHLATRETMILNIELKTLKPVKAMPSISAKSQFNNYNKSLLMVAITIG